METRDRVRNMIARDLTVREIAQLLGVSTQAVYKHLKRIEEEDSQETAA